jgi:hypothetical protein
MSECEAKAKQSDELILNGPPRMQMLYQLGQAVPQLVCQQHRPTVKITRLSPVTLLHPEDIQPASLSHAS